MNNLMKRVISVLTAIVMMMACLPISVSADDKIPQISVGGGMNGTLSPDRAVEIEVRSEKGGQVQFKLKLADGEAAPRVSLGGGVSLNRSEDTYSFTRHFSAGESLVLSMSADRETGYSLSTKMIQEDPEEEIGTPEEPAGEEPGKTEEHAVTEETDQSEEPAGTDDTDKTEDPAATDDTDKTEEPAATDDTGKTEEPAATDDTDKTEEPAVTDDTDKTEEPAATDDTDKTEEPVVTDDTDETEEPAVTDDTVKTEEPAVTDDIDKTEEPAVTDDTDKTEEPAATDDADKTEEPAVTDDTDKTEEPAVTDDADKTEEPAVTDDTDKTEEPAATDDTDKTEEPVVTDDTDKTEEPAATDDTDKTEEPAGTDDTDKTEEPVVTDDTDTTEEPVVTNDTDKTEEPVVTDDTDTTEEPAVTNDTDKTEEPVVTDDTDTTKEPVVTNDTDKTEEPVVTDDTNKTEEPAATDDTDKTEEPAATDDTDKTEEPAVTDDTDQTEELAATDDTDKTEEPAATDDADDTNDAEVPAADEPADEKAEEPVQEPELKDEQLKEEQPEEEPEKATSYRFVKGVGAVPVMRSAPEGDPEEDQQPTRGGAIPLIQIATVQSVTATVNGEPVGQAEYIERDAQLQIDVSYMIPNTSLGTAADNTPWTYDVSAWCGTNSIFSGLVSVENGRLLENGSEVGTYTITSGGLVSLYPDPEWLKGKTDLAGSFSITAQLNERANQVADSNHFQFPGGEDTTVTFLHKEIEADKYALLNEESTELAHAVTYDKASGNDLADTASTATAVELVGTGDGRYILYNRIRVNANCKPNTELTVVDTLEGGQTLGPVKVYVGTTEVPTGSYLSSDDTGFTLDLKRALAAKFSNPSDYVGEDVWIEYYSYIQETDLDKNQKNTALVKYDSKELTPMTSVTPKHETTVNPVKKMSNNREINDPVVYGTTQNQTLPVSTNGNVYFVTAGVLSSPATSLTLTDTPTGVTIDKTTVRVGIGTETGGYHSYVNVPASRCTIDENGVLTLDVYDFIKYLVENNVEDSAELYKNLYYPYPYSGEGTFTLKAGTAFRVTYGAMAQAGYMPAAGENQGTVSNTASWNAYGTPETATVSAKLTNDAGEPTIKKNGFDLGMNGNAANPTQTNKEDGTANGNHMVGTWLRYELTVANKTKDGSILNLAGTTVTDHIKNYIKNIPETIDVYEITGTGSGRTETLVASYNTANRQWTYRNDNNLGLSITVADNASVGIVEGVESTQYPAVTTALGSIGISYDLFRLTFPEGGSFEHEYTIKYKVQSDDVMPEGDGIYGAHALENTGTAVGIDGKSSTTTITTNIDYHYPYSSSKTFLGWDESSNEAIWAVDIPLADDLTEIKRPLEIIERYDYSQAWVTTSDSRNITADSYSFAAYELLPGGQQGAKLNEVTNENDAAQNEYYVRDLSTDPYPRRILVFPKGINKDVRVIVRARLPRNLSELDEYHIKNMAVINIDVNSLEVRGNGDYYDNAFDFTKEGRFISAAEDPDGKERIRWDADINPTGKKIADTIKPVFRDTLPDGLVLDGEISVYGYKGNYPNAAFVLKTTPASSTGSFELDIISLLHSNWENTGVVTKWNPYVYEEPEALSGWHFRVVYYTTIDPEKKQAINAAISAGELKDFAFTNQAELYNQGGSTPLKRDSDRVKYEYDDLISKEDVSSRDSAGNIQILTYRVVINEKAKKVNNGRSVLMSDTIPSIMSLMLESVTVKDTAGNSISGATVSYSDSSRRLEISVPDETTAVVTFSALPTGGNTAYVNTVVLSGSDFSQTDTVEADHKISSAGTLTGVSNAVNILKVDKYDISTPLEGAKFAFYECRVGSDGEILGETKIGEYTTSNKGTITFAPVKSNTLYYWQETQAPENYIIASSDPHYFTVYQELTASNKVTVPWNLLSADTRAAIKTKFPSYSLIQPLGDDDTMSVYVKAFGPSAAQQEEYDTYQYCWLSAADYPSGTGYGSLREEVNAANRKQAETLADLAKGYYEGQKNVASVASGYKWQVDNIKSDVTTVQLEATKQLNGRQMKEKEFTFLLYDDTVTDDSYLRQTKPGPAGADGEVASVAFDPIPISAAGTYKYRIVEKTGSAENVTYDPAIYNITVTADYDETEGSATYGRLVATVTGITRTVNGTTETVSDLSSPVPFVNTYTQPSGTLNLTGTKTLTGRAMDAREFNFTVKEGDKTVTTGTNASAADGLAGVITFGTIRYTQTGTHTYTVTEDDPSGLPYVSQTGTTSFEVVVSVTDPDSNGNLVASVVSVNGVADGTIAFTNKYDVPKITLTGTKAWSDGVSRDNKSLIILELYRFTEGGTPELYTLSQVQWTGNTYTYENLPAKDDSGNDYTYYVIESGLDESIREDCTSVTYANTAVGHTSETDRAYNEGTITNTVVPQTGSLSVKKTVSETPESAATKTYRIRVKQGDTVYNQDGTVAAAGEDGYVSFSANETKKWENLPLGDYTVEEDETDAQIGGYSLSVTGTGDVTVGTDENKVTVTNTYTQKKGQLKVTKVFGSGSAYTLDNLSADQKAAITFTYVKDDDSTVTDSVTLAQFTGDSYTWTDLPVGSYTVTESGEDFDSTNYSVTSSVSVDPDKSAVTETAAEEVTVTNTYTQKKGQLKVTKVFGSGSAFTLDNLSADQKAAITFTYVKDDDSTVTDSVTLAQFTGNSYTWSDLPVGSYTVTESGEDFDSTNYSVTSSVSVDPDKNTVTETAAEEVTVTNTYTRKTASVKVTKAFSGLDKLPAEFKIVNTYNDEVFTVDNATGTAPYTWQIDEVPTDTVIEFTESGIQADGYTLKVNGAAVTADTATATATATEGTVETAELVNEYTEIIYKTVHDKVEIYKQNKDLEPLDGAEFTLYGKDTCTEADRIKIYSGKKISIDTEDADLAGYLPDDPAVTGMLYLKETKAPEGYVLDGTVHEVTVTVGIRDPEYDAEKDAFVVTTTYSIEIDGEEKINITNNKTQVRIQKTDIANGEELSGATIQILDKDGNVVDEWVSEEGKPHLIEGLKTGEEYTLRETVAPEGYDIATDTFFTVSETGEVTSTGTIRDDGVLLVEDWKTPLVSATVKKVWQDDNNRDGKRPGSVTAELLANGAKTGKTVTLSDANGWMSRIDELPKHNAAGETISYTWAEQAVDGYTLTGNTTKGTLTTLTNTYSPEKTNVRVEKVWVDNGKHPDEVKVQLFADGKVMGEAVTLNAGNGWKYSWDDLCRHDAGQEIRYTVAETEIPAGYTAKITGNASAGYVITNTRLTGGLVIEKEFDIQVPEEEPEEEEMTTQIEIIKIWDDDNNKDGNRPGSVTVHLFAGGTEVKEFTLSEANGWRRTVGDLPKFVDGHPIHYSVTEDPVEWYIPEIHGFTIQNRYVPETVSVTVKKVWNDNNNRLGTRPLSVAMYLNNGMIVILNEENNWTATVADLPARINGKPAEYTWTEGETLGYELEDVTVNGNTTVFTNRIWTRPETPAKGKKPQTLGETLYKLEEYDTPLGVDVVINHVGDCFD